MINWKEITKDMYLSVLSENKELIEDIKKKFPWDILNNKDKRAIIEYHMEQQWMWIDYFLSKAKDIIEGKITWFSESYKERLNDRFLEFLWITDKQPIVMATNTQNNWVSEKLLEKMIDKIWYNWNGIENGIIE